MPAFLYPSEMMNLQRFQIKGMFGQTLPIEMSQQHLPPSGDVSSSAVNSLWITLQAVQSSIENSLQGIKGRLGGLE